MDIAETWVNYSREVQFEDLPNEAVQSAKKLTLDTLGVMLVGSSASGIGTMAELFRAWGGKPESRIFLSGTKVPLPNAVLVNAAMARAHDFDSFHETAMVHPSAPIVPACLAVAEKLGGSDGKEFLTALVLGMEFMCRLGLSVDSSFLLGGFQTTNHVGTFGTALGVGRLLRLDARKMVHALGIAYGQIAGTLQAAVEGSVMVRIQQGFAAQIGVLSAILAENGIDGPREVFQGKFGYFPVFQQNRYDPSVLSRDLGKQFEVSQISVKSFPCCLLAHSSIAAMLRLREEERVDPQTVAKIQARVNQGAFNVVCQPLEQKRNPSSTREALFSLPYTVASALTRGHVSLEDFTDEALQEKEVRALANRVTAMVDKEIEEKYGRIIGPAVVEVILRDGRTLSRRVDFVKGNPQNPMSMGEVEEKFQRCLSFSIHRFEKKTIEGLLQQVRELDSLKDVSRILDHWK
jgi:2-methylcitrate dehydratase PrpD